MADELWSAWKYVRNRVFHYFPHNLRALTLEDAEERISQILKAMQGALQKCDVEGIYLGS